MLYNIKNIKIRESLLTNGKLQPLEAKAQPRQNTRGSLAENINIAICNLTVLQAIK